LRWLLPRGALGVVTGAIAIGTAGTSTSITTIISIKTTTLTATTSIEVRDKVSGSTIRNTAAMLPTVTGEQQISLAETNAARAEEDRAEEGPVVSAELVVQAELAVRVVSAELVDREALAELASQEALAELVDQEALAELANQVAEPELGQVAVAPRTKSVTAAHHRDLVHLEAEDLAAAAVETTREPAATEAVVAWVAAV